MKGNEKGEKKYVKCILSCMHNFLFSCQMIHFSAVSACKTIEMGW